MAIATLADLTYRAANPTEVKFIGKSSATNVPVGRWSSLWLTVGTPDPGSTPSTAAAPDRTTTGALGQTNGGAAALRLLRAHVIGSTLGPGGLMICDRLSHQGGLSGTTTGAQTTNLPTAALTRYTTGAGVMMGLEIYTAIGTTATTVTVSYTNQAGTAGQVSDAVIFGGAGNDEVGKFVPLSLAAGDSGVRSVESVTLAASTVSAAGNFGVTLFKPLMVVPILALDSMCDAVPPLSMGGFLPEILDDACLFFLATSASTSNNTLGPFQGILRFSED